MVIARFSVAAVVFAAAWLLWSGHFTPLLLFFGVVSVLLALWLAARIGFLDLEAYAFHLAPRLPRYWLWLLKEIAKANVTVAKIVLSRRMPISPTVISVDASELAPVTQVLLANSITLTPGTVSIDVDRGVIEVHCLTVESARDLKSGDMLRHAGKVAGD
ncbi:MAG TPA: Na+/H+ antiporter subunit E [Woeseiaceae bacterium]|nr:Na+/H+ antiporter subunit E [Woeseiaceae bacterium]